MGSFFPVTAPGAGGGGCIFTLKSMPKSSKNEICLIHQGAPHLWYLLRTFRTISAKRTHPSTSKRRGSIHSTIVGSSPMSLQYTMRASTRLRPPGRGKHTRSALLAGRKLKRRKLRLFRTFRQKRDEGRKLLDVQQKSKHEQTRAQFHVA